MPPYKLLIGGEYVDTAERYDVVSPGNAEVIATLNQALANECPVKFYPGVSYSHLAIIPDSAAAPSAARAGARGRQGWGGPGAARVGASRPSSGQVRSQMEPTLVVAPRSRNARASSMSRSGGVARPVGDGLLGGTCHVLGGRRLGRLRVQLVGLLQQPGRLALVAGCAVGPGQHVQPRQLVAGITDIPADGRLGPPTSPAPVETQEQPEPPGHPIHLAAAGPQTPDPPPGPRASSRAAAG